MILLYHGIVPDSDPVERWCAGQALPLSTFREHLKWLSSHYHIVPLADYMAGLHRQPLWGKRKVLALTFDDGLQTTFQCVLPLLLELDVPATFFVATGHLEHGELLWFSYLNALCFEKLYDVIEVDRHIYSLQTVEQRRKTRYILDDYARASCDPITFSKMLSRKYPLSSSVIAIYQGMTYEQLRIAGKNDLIEIGGHTITHPYLDRSPNEMYVREVSDCKQVLSDLSGKPVRYFAYPGGKYDQGTLALVKAAGYEAALTIISKQLGYDNRFELDRMGVYSPSLTKLKMKAMGVANLARQLGLRVG